METPAEPAAAPAEAAAPAALGGMAAVIASTTDAGAADKAPEDPLLNPPAAAGEGGDAAPAASTPAEPPAAPVDDAAGQVAAMNISDTETFQYLLNPPAEGSAQVSMGSSRAKSTSVPADTNGTLGEGLALDAEERRVLALVREKGGEEIEEMSNELLTRCLRGYSDYPDRVGDTAAAILKIVRWRREQGMAEVLGKQLEHHDAFNANWPCMLCGEDSEGHVIQYESLATMNTANLAKNIENGSVPLAALVRQRAQVYEAVDEYKRKAGAARAAAAAAHGEGGAGLHGRRYKAVYIFVFDLQGFSFNLLTKKIREILKAVIGIGGEMFPEAMATMYLINAPMAFRAAWSLIKPWLHPITQKKIYLLGNQAKYQPVMEAGGIKLSELPECMGGTHPGIMCADLVTAV